MLHPMLMTYIKEDEILNVYAHVNVYNSYTHTTRVIFLYS